MATLLLETCRDAEIWYEVVWASVSEDIDFDKTHAETKRRMSYYETALLVGGEERLIARLRDLLSLMRQALTSPGIAIAPSTRGLEDLTYAAACDKLAAYDLGVIS